MDKIIQLAIIYNNKKNMINQPNVDVVVVWQLSEEDKDVVHNMLQSEEQKVRHWVHQEKLELAIRLIVMLLFH